MNSIKVCLVCNHENSADAVKCAQCGAPLKVAETLFVRNKSQGDTYDVYRNQNIEVEPGHIAIHVVGTVKQFHVEVTDRITMGRLIPGEPAPSIDLTDYRAGLLGVSRHHAAIYPTRQGYMLEDMGSANGTWLNDSELIPNTPYELHNRDQIRMGDLVLFVFLRDHSTD